MKQLLEVARRPVKLLVALAIALLVFGPLLAGSAA